MCIDGSAIQDALTADMKRFNECTEHIILLDRMAKTLQGVLDAPPDDFSKSGIGIGITMPTLKTVETIFVRRNEATPPNCEELLKVLIDAIKHQSAYYENEREIIGQRWTRVKELIDMN